MKHFLALTLLTAAMSAFAPQVTLPPPVATITQPLAAVDMSRHVSAPAERPRTPQPASPDEAWAAYQERQDRYAQGANERNVVVLDVADVPDPEPWMTLRVRLVDVV